MSKGTLLGTAASVELLAADANRDHVTFSLTNATSVSFGFGEDAVADEGAELHQKGDVLTVHEDLARGAINILGDGGTGSYQTGKLELVRGPTPA